MKQEFNCSCINRHSLMQKNDIVMQLTKAHLKAEQSIKLIPHCNENCNLQYPKDKITHNTNRNFKAYTHKVKHEYIYFTCNSVARTKAITKHAGINDKKIITLSVTGSNR